MADSRDSETQLTENKTVDVLSVSQSLFGRLAELAEYIDVDAIDKPVNRRPPSKFGIRSCGGNGNCAIPSASSWSHTRTRMVCLSIREGGVGTTYCLASRMRAVPHCRNEYPAVPTVSLVLILIRAPWGRFARSDDAFERTVPKALESGSRPTRL